jgi:hypothetical protein
METPDLSTKGMEKFYEAKSSINGEIFLHLKSPFPLILLFSGLQNFKHSN